jgi:hypothetical protein
MLDISRILQINIGLSAMTDSSCRIYHGSQLIEQLANLTSWGTWICQELVYTWIRMF